MMVVTTREVQQSWVDLFQLKSGYFAFVGVGWRELILERLEYIPGIRISQDTRRDDVFSGVAWCVVQAFGVTGHVLVLPAGLGVACLLVRITHTTIVGMHGTVFQGVQLIPTGWYIQLTVCVANIYVPQRPTGRHRRHRRYRTTPGTVVFPRERSVGRRLAKRHGILVLVVVSKGWWSVAAASVLLLYTRRLRRVHYSVAIRCAACRLYRQIVSLRGRVVVIGSRVGVAQLKASGRCCERVLWERICVGTLGNFHNKGSVFARAPLYVRAVVSFLRDKRHTRCVGTQQERYRNAESREDKQPTLGSVVVVAYAKKNIHVKHKTESDTHVEQRRDHFF